jgi:hypothetical protein
MIGAIHANCLLPARTGVAPDALVQSGGAGNALSRSACISASISTDVRDTTVAAATTPLSIEFELLTAGLRR